MGTEPKFQVFTLQEKALGIMNNWPRNSHSGLLFKKNNILKFENKTVISNIIFIGKSNDNLLPPIFKRSVQRLTTMAQSHR